MPPTDEDVFGDIFVTEAECCECTEVKLTTKWMSTKDMVCRDCYGLKVEELTDAMVAEFTIEKGRKPTAKDFHEALSDPNSFMADLTRETGGVLVDPETGRRIFSDEEKDNFASLGEED